MAAPTVPSDDSDGNDWTAAKINAIYDHLSWWRDERPIIQVVASISALATSTFDQIPLSTGSGFTNAPTINIGSWVHETSGDGILVPQNGLYQIHAQFSFEAINTTGYRRGRVLDAGSSIGAADSTHEPVGSAALDTFHSVSIRSFTANDVVDLDVFQTSGQAMDIQGLIEMIWIGP